MSWDNIERIARNLGELRYRGRISWFWINEPLIDVRMEQILRLSREHCPNAFLSLVTNGDNLTEELYADLRSWGLDALGVSVYDDTIFEKATQLQTKGNNRLVVMDRRQDSPQLLDNRGGNIKLNADMFAERQERFLSRTCERPSTTLTLNTMGQAVLCCSDMYSDVIMGDIETNRLEEIWHNDKFNYYRKTLAEHGRSELPLCKTCSCEGRPQSRHYPLFMEPK